MWLEYNRYQMLTVIFVLIYNGCNATNAIFNEQLRDYSVNGNEVPDSEISGSSHGRGLLHHERTPGYGLLDYEDGHYGHGYEHQTHDFGHLEPHDYQHYDYHDAHHGGHHLGYGHHHKHYDYALAAKTILWPFAGLALLGAAAALVSNPVLFQLGVVSGKRKRRQTEDLDLVKSSIKKWSPKSAIENIGQGIQRLPNLFVKRRLIQEDLKDKLEVTRNYLAKPSSKIVRRRFTDEDILVPVPLEFREP